MSTENNHSDEQIRNAFEKALNRQGYGFQYSVLKKVLALFGRGSQWYLETSEFPVAQGPGTRIDFILRHRGQKGLYLLAECKRANPAYSDWCFARAPYIHDRRHSNHEELILEHVENEPDGVSSYSRKLFYLPNAYHVALEVKNQTPGNPSGETGRTIEDAATQVCRGLNGMVEFFSRNPKYLGDGDQAIFLPVIFTTARTWGSSVDLSDADLETGDVNLKDSKFTQEPWVAYQYHQSPGLKHSLESNHTLKSLGEFMDMEYVRTIPIITASGVESFLKWSSQRNYIFP
jgi:hypothetical protein